MNDLLPRNVVLPAVLISSAVFATLTLPFVLFTSDSFATQVPTALRNQFQPIFRNQNKEMAIRYVGCSIVASVGSGIFTIDLLRRLKASRKFDPIQNYLSNYEQDSEPLAEVSEEFSILDIDQKDDVSSVLIVGTEYSSAFVTETEYLEGEEAIALKTISDDQMFSSQLMQDLDTFSPDSSEMGLQSVTQNSNVALILESHQQYQTCRIQVPDHDRRLFAVLLDGHYYSLLRTQKNRDKALTMAAKLKLKGDKAIITKMERHYAIWIWQPEAYLESIS
ncbi:MAG: hypothetical protein HC769_09520 [Cyanobacteria bacterium CRU_2_1]|nr:hypothetical protein [Cyanobacteria bacterium CRU_2_1]